MYAQCCRLSGLEASDLRACVLDGAIERPERRFAGRTASGHALKMLLDRFGGDSDAIGANSERRTAQAMGNIGQDLRFTIYLAQAGYKFGGLAVEHCQQFRLQRRVAIRLASQMHQVDSRFPCSGALRLGTHWGFKGLSGEHFGLRLRKLRVFHENSTFPHLGGLDGGR